MSIAKDDVAIPGEWPPSWRTAWVESCFRADGVAPPVPVPDELPGVMPVQSFVPPWRVGGTLVRFATWHTLIHAWAGVIALLLTILDNGR